jgi:hypothetical protein
MYTKIWKVLQSIKRLVSDRFHNSSIKMLNNALKVCSILRKCAKWIAILENAQCRICAYLPIIGILIALNSTTAFFPVQFRDGVSKSLS